MAKKRSKKAKEPSPLAEILEHLDAMKQDPSASQVRLRADLVRDSAEELFSKMRKQMRRQVSRLRKLQERSERWRNRLNNLLDELSTGVVILPAIPDRPAVSHDNLVATYQRLRADDFPELALTLQTSAKASDLPAYQRFLTDEIMVKGGRIVAEFLVRRANSAADEAGGFLERLRHHVAGNVCQGLARMVNYRVTPEVGSQLDHLITEALNFLTDLLTTTPSARLLIPHDREEYNPEKHHPVLHRAPNGAGEIAALLFPGYMVLTDPIQIVEKAQVVVVKAQEESPEEE